MLILKDLVCRSNDDLAGLDLAEAHLVCAAGFPGVSDADRDGCLVAVTDYAGIVKGYTEVSLARWREQPQDGEVRCEAQVRIRCMADVFTQKLGLRFDPDAFDGRRHPMAGGTFLFGLTATKRYTHATFPVLWAAVGRRLGYPIKLVSGRWRSGNSHLFPRWEEPCGVCLNIEVTRKGVQCLPMEHYRDSGDYFVPADEERRCRLLRTKTPREELGHFLVQRGHAWLDFGRFRFAVESYAWASALAPHNVSYAEQLTACIRAWHAALERRKLPAWPDVVLVFDRRRFSEVLPREVEQDILLLQATESLLITPDLDARFWEPARRGHPVRMPARVTATFEGEECLLRVEDRPAQAPAGPPVRPLLRYPVWSPPPLPPTPPSPVVVPALASGLTRSGEAGTRLHWRDLVEKDDEELAAIDLARRHFACMADLPDAAGVSVEQCLDRVEVLTRSVQRFTEGRVHRFHRAPEEFNHSEAYFRVLCMITHLQRDWGLRYNPAKGGSSKLPLDTADRFLHGLLFGNGGTCATMPVLYAVIGRRLGYPIKLSWAKSPDGLHTFARWEGDGERFNIEATGRGLSCLTDDEYREGRYEGTRELEGPGQFLVTQTPRTELAISMMDRGYCWSHLDRQREAVESFVWALALAPADDVLYSILAQTEIAWREGLAKRRPEGFPDIHFFHALRWPDVLTQRTQSCILLNEATEALLDDPWCEEHWWAPLRRGENVKVPPLAVGRFDGAGRAEIEFEY
jgi:hypothetical protein